MRAAAAIFLTIVLSSPAAFVRAGGDSSKERDEVETIIRSMYARKLRDFEFPSGKAEARKACEYYRSLFDERLLTGADEKCDLNVPIFVRFPNLASEDMSELYEAGRLPKSRIVSSSVNGGQAVVKVQAPIAKGLTPTRIVYFLRKSDERWRISNVLAYSEWPLNTNREGGCKDVSSSYRYALPPKTVSDLEDLPSACQESELGNRPELRKGR